jgi:hypothetical protein
MSVSKAAKTLHFDCVGKFKISRKHHLYAQKNTDFQGGDLSGIIEFKKPVFPEIPHDYNF